MDIVYQTPTRDSIQNSTLTSRTKVKSHNAFESIKTTTTTATNSLTFINPF